LRHRDPEFDSELASTLDPGRENPLAPWLDRALGWVAGHRRAVLVAGAAFQVLVLLYMVATAARPFVGSGSRTVLLHVVPVDPRDLFRGDYVTLSYDISRIPVAEASTDTSGQTVYVGLAPDADGRHYHGVTASLSPPAQTPAIPLYIRGTLSGPGRIIFGIESYYVPEGQGKPYEDAARNQTLSAEVVIGSNGQAALKRLVIE
jgi:uncharacterized membrane-anchored protein